jgi:hypothetical protein
VNRLDIAAYGGIFLNIDGGFIQSFLDLRQIQLGPDFLDCLADVIIRNREAKQAEVVFEELFYMITTLPEVDRAAGYSGPFTITRAPDLLSTKNVYKTVVVRPYVDLLDRYWTCIFRKELIANLELPEMQLRTDEIEPVIHGEKREVSINYINLGLVQFNCDPDSPAAGRLVIRLNSFPVPIYDLGEPDRTVVELVKIRWGG